MKLPNTLFAIVLPTVLIITFGCSKESFSPPSPGDVEPTLESIPFLVGILGGLPLIMRPAPL